MRRKFKFLSLMLVLCLCMTSLGIQGAAEENQEALPLPAPEQVQTVQEPAQMPEAEYADEAAEEITEDVEDEATEEIPEAGQADEAAGEITEDVEDEAIEEITEDTEDVIVDTEGEPQEEVPGEQPEEDTSMQDDAETLLPVQENTLMEDGEDPEFLQDEPGAIKINFQPPGTEIPEGYIPDYGEVYGVRNGYTYGWNTLYTGTMRDREVNADQKLDTLVTLYKTGKWEIEVENGHYEVTVCAGDAGFSSTPTVNVEGVNYWSAVDLGANQFLQETKTVMIADGRLTLDNGGTTDGVTKINYVEIVKNSSTFPIPENIQATAAEDEVTVTWDGADMAAGYEIEADGQSYTTAEPSFVHQYLEAGTPHTYRVRIVNGGIKGDWSEPVTIATLPEAPGTVKINFQPSGSEIPEGYIPDYGEIYGSRNGYTYGWNTLYTGTMRDREVNADQKRDTLVTLYKTGKWEIEVENGLYEVTVCAGDAGFSSAPTVNVEGVNYWSAVELGANRFVKETGILSITDGKITIDNGGTADAVTKLNYVKIVQVNPSFLSNLALSNGTLSPAFDGRKFAYTANVPYDTASITLAATAGDSGAVITVNGEQVESGGISSPISLELGSNTILVKVTASDGSSVTEYTVTVVRKSELYFKDIAAGYRHSIALRNDGTVWAWGYNYYGQLGDGTNTYRTTPVHVSGIGGVKAVTAGDDHTIALKEDGTVWAWGDNYYGQLGDGTATDRKTPVRVSGISGIKAVAAGDYHTVALKEDGTVWAWGYNYSGQLGDGTIANSTIPVQVSGLSGIKAVAAGDSHTIALKEDGTVWTWGWNSYGQLGDGTTTESTTPVQVSGISGIKAVAAGDYHTVALKEDGTVWAWGRNSEGQLGDGTTANSTTPVQVSGISGIKAVGTGGYHTAALKEDGAVWAWGYNGYGQLGDGTTTNRTIPAQVSGLNGIKSVAAGDYHTIALKEDRTVWVWGDNYFGQLGNGESGNVPHPMRVYLNCDEAVENNAVFLSKLSLSKGQLSPAFTENTFSYTANVPYDTSSITVIPTAGDSGTVITVNGEQVESGGTSNPISLEAGSNTISVKVTAPDGSSVTEYTVTVTRGGSAYLSDLTLSGIPIEFDRNTYSYNASIEYGTASTTVTPTLEDSAASVLVTVNGTELPSGQTAGLNVGTNTISVQVTAIDGVKQTYTVTVVRENSIYFKDIAAGDYHTIAIKEDGTVWAWGYNRDGQLGDGTATDRTTPVQVSGLSGIKAVAAGNYRTIALREDGTVWAWGDGWRTPVQVSGLSGVKAVAAGGDHMIALKEDGTVWAWGDNDYGQLGDGTTTRRMTPVQVSGLSGIKAAAAGNFHTVALKEDGTVWAWGSNFAGQLGDGTATHRTTPVQVSGLSGIKAVASGYSHTIALKEDGTVWSWGLNDDGQLGDSTTTNRTTPVQVNGLSGIKAVASGYSHTIALKEDGTVWSWGLNDDGQLGDGTTTDRTTSVRVSGLSGIRIIATGGRHTIALKEDRTVWVWGWNDYGQLGDGTTTRMATPVQIGGLSGVKAVTAGDSHTIALKEDGTVWTSGDNTYGQLGDGTITDRETPVQVSVISGIKSVASGYSHTIALKEDGTVWVWGNNNYGQLGDGTVVNRIMPVQVSDLSGIKSVAAGRGHTVALKEDGTVWAWGGNSCGQLGDGTTTYMIITPVQVSGLSGIKSVAAGGSHTIALKEDGTVWAWGYNHYGQLGDGTTTDRTTPVRVSGLSGIKSVAAGESHTIALKEDGTVWVWGYNHYGQLGDGTNVDRATPVQISSLSRIKAIAAGGSHTIALKEDRTVWTWGYNYSGQLGDGTTALYVYTQRATPVQVSGLSGIKSVAAGESHTIALKEDGTVWAWGYNLHGQLGNGEAGYVLQPKQVYLNCGETIEDNPVFLSNITLSNGTLNPAFTENTFAYTANVPYDTSSITVIPTAGDSGTVITVSGEQVESGGTSNPISLEVGSNTISVKVTAPDGSSVTEYTVTVVRGGSAYLTDLTLSGIPIEFDKNTYSYNASIEYDTASTTVIPTLEDGTASVLVTVNGTEVPSGQVVGLNVGTNTISVQVTAIDGVKQTYTVTVTRAGSAYLSNLTLGGIPIEFSRSTYSYNTSIEYDTASTTVIPTLEDSAASVLVTVNGTELPLGQTAGLNVGTNTISVQVTAINRVQQTYTVTVVRAGSAYLSNLTLGGIPIEFSRSTYSYNTSIEYGTANTTVTPTLEDGTASVLIKVNGTELPSGQVVGLNVGTNTISVQVTAIDGVQQNYTVTVVRAGSTYLSNLTLGGIPIGFNKSTYSYNASIGYYTASTIVIPVLEDSTAAVLVTVNGIELPSGQMSGLNVGTNTISVQVTAINRVQQTYTVTVVRESRPYFKDIAAGDYHTVALKEDGTVWAWGYNRFGELGDGTTIDRTTPVQVSGISGIKAVAAGSYYTIALKEDGTVWAWGINSQGELGDGTTTKRTTPVQVSGLSGIKAVTIKGSHTIALKEDGTVWAWGYNMEGQLGDGTTTFYGKTTPVQVSGLSGIKAVVAGYSHTIALKADGTVWTWGYNGYGQLGDGTYTDRTTPVQVSGLSRIKAVAAGGSHTIALKEDGTVWAWGYNNYGELGDGASTFDRTTPVQVSGLSGIKAVVAGGNHTIALKEDGTVWAWGYNGQGRLGDGTTTNRTTPVQVSSLSGIKAVAAGSNHTIALKEGGTVWAWGWNVKGQLGDGTTTDRITPVQV